MKTTIYVPEDMIFEIMLRLPVKSLVRFKCVSKSWLSLISDPYFTTSHFELAFVPRDRLLLTMSDSDEVLSVDFNGSLHNFAQIVPLKVEFPGKPCERVQIIGSCRGFLLLDCVCHLCLWNPSTCVNKQVSYSPIASDKGTIFFMFLQGFSYDPSTDDYLLVQVFQGIVYPENQVEFFSLKENTWKEIDATSFCYTNSLNHCFETQSGLVFNDSIHWLASSDKTGVPINVIVAFDLKERNILEIPLPTDVEAEYSHLCVLEESLNVTKCHNFHYVEILAMQKYKVQSSWTKTIVVCLDDQTLHFSPICSTKYGDIVGNDGYDGLRKFNNKGKFQEFRRYFSGQYGLYITMHTYTDSLLSLPYTSQ